DEFPPRVLHGEQALEKIHVISPSPRAGQFRRAQAAFAGQGRSRGGPGFGKLRRRSFFSGHWGSSGGGKGSQKSATSGETAVSCPLVEVAAAHVQPAKQRGQ